MNALPDDILTALARAATPDERADRDAFAAVDDDLVPPRLAAWRRAVTAGDEERFRRLLSLRGISEPQCQARLATVRFVDPSRLPQWATDSLAWFADLAEDDGAQVPAAIPYPRAFAAPLRVAAAWLDRRLEGSPVGWEAGARVGLLGGLCERWAGLAAAVFAHRPGLVGWATDGEASDVRTRYEQAFERGGPGWRAVATEFPVLARLLGTATRFWQESVAELVDRLASDRDAIRAITGTPVERITAASPGRGDPHLGGRGVVVLSCEPAGTLVYKPRDHRVTEWWNAFVADLAATCEGFEVPTRKLIAFPTHAWEEFVPTDECRGDAAAGRLYRRCGQLLRALQLLAGSDMNGENVLVRRDEPVAIDLECLFQPEPRPAAGDTAGPPPELSAALADSVMAVALVSSQVHGEPGRRSVDLSAFAYPDPLPAPFPLPRSQVDETGRNAVAFDYYPVRSVGVGRHVVAARRSARDHACAVTAGYAAAQEGLATAFPTHGDRWLARLGEVAGFPVRFLLRPTQVYARVLAGALQPDRMRDGVAFDLALEPLWKATLAGGSPVVATASEVAALRCADVPIFFARPGSDSLFTADGREAAGFFLRPPIARVSERLRRIPTHDTAADVDLIRSLIGTVPNGQPWSPRRSTFRTPDEWKALAVEVGDAILAAAVETQTGPHWVGLTYRAEFDAAEIRPLTGDVFDGRGGLTVALAGLARSTGLARFADATGRLLAQAMTDLECWPAIAAQAARERGRTGHSVLPLGPGSPFGGAVTTLLLVGNGPQQEAALAALERAVGPEWFELVGQCSPADWGGLAGLLALVAGIPSPTAGSIADRLAACVRIQISAGTPAPPSRPPGSTWGERLPGYEAGLAVAFHRLARRSGAGEDRHLACRFARAAGRGTVGDRLALLDCKPGARVRPRSGRLLDRIALASGDRAELVMNRLADRRQFSGRWFPHDLVADRHQLSAVGGLAAIVLQALRFADRTPFVDVRLLRAGASV